MALQKMHLEVEMVDGTVYTDITPTLADQMAYSRTRQSQKWAPMSEDPITFVNFLAFSALRRRGDFDGGFDKFCNEAVAVGESEPSEDVNPTQPEA